MDVFNNGWIHAVGVLCVLYIIFGGEASVKIVSFVILLGIALLEFEMSTQFFSKFFTKS